jgi:hypothetical protein
MLLGRMLQHSLPSNFRTNELNLLAISAPRQRINSVFITTDTVWHVSTAERVLLNGRCSIAGRARDLSLFHSSQTGVLAHPVTLQMLFPRGIKQQGPLTLTSCRGHEWWSYTSTPPYVLMACYFLPSLLHVSAIISHRQKIYYEATTLRM